MKVFLIAALLTAFPVAIVADMSSSLSFGTVTNEVRAEVNHETGEVETVFGIGEPPNDADMNEAQRIVWAISQARANAVANTAQALAEINVGSKEQLTDLQLTRREISAEFEYVLRDFYRISIGKQGSSYIAKVRLPLTGEKGALRGLYDKMSERYDTQATDPGAYYDPAWQQAQPQTPAAPAENFGAYTGLIVDASGLGAETSFSPRILTSDGRIVYNLKKADIQWAKERGLVGYTSDAQNYPSFVRDRIGDHPLHVKALKVQEKVDIVVSPEDAGRIVHTDQLRNILKECRVTFALGVSSVQVSGTDY